MSESNTPPENQKKKSAFSRFFSRKKKNTVEQSADSEILSQDNLNTELDQSNFGTDLSDTAKIQESEETPAQTTSTHESTQSIPSETTNEADEANTSQQPAINDTPQTAKHSHSTQEPVSTTDNAEPQKADASATVEDGLTKSRSSFFQKITNVFKRSFNLDDELFDELEELLITSDIGIDASLNLVEKLRTRVKKEKIQDAKGVVTALRTEITSMLEQSEEDWQFSQKPYVILMVGVNGAGKTTTTAKIAKQFQDQGKSVMLAAADTFRAAAVEQLKEWGNRLDIPVIAQSHGADAAAVAHDALVSAIAKNVDILMIDTAGCLHTQSDLMEQLTKINRVLAKIDPSTPHEVMQVLDAGTGQNALTQLEHFQKAVGVSSICLSCLLYTSPSPRDS